MVDFVIVGICRQATIIITTVPGGPVLVTKWIICNPRRVGGSSPTGMILCPSELPKNNNDWVKLHYSSQRWRNSVLMTEYKYEYYSTFQKWANMNTSIIRFKNRPNTNTNIICFEKGDRIQIQISFGLKKASEYEYEYYSLWKKQPNTNANIIRFENIDRIRIRIRILVFGINNLNNIRIPNYSLTSVWTNHKDKRPT